MDDFRCLFVIDCLKFLVLNFIFLTPNFLLIYYKINHSNLFPWIIKSIIDLIVASIIIIVIRWLVIIICFERVLHLINITEVTDTVAWLHRGCSSFAKRRTIWIFIWMAAGEIKSKVFRALGNGIDFRLFNKTNEFIQFTL